MEFHMSTAAAQSAAAHAYRDLINRRGEPTFAELCAWRTFAAENMRLAEEVATQVAVVSSEEAEPYATHLEMFEDIDNNGRLVISTANCDHPEWSKWENFQFRVVHDYYGHYMARSGFDMEGERKACEQHARRLCYEVSRMALYTECIGQTAAAIYYGAFLEQVVGFLPVKTERWQK